MSRSWSSTEPVPPNLAYAVAEALTMRERSTLDITPARLAEHQRTVERWLVEHPREVEAALRAARVTDRVSLEMAVDRLLPHLIPLTGVMAHERAQY